jgi:hypothetical protein
MITLMFSGVSVSDNYIIPHKIRGVPWDTFVSCQPLCCLNATEKTKEILLLLSNGIFAYITDSADQSAVSWP